MPSLIQPPPAKMGNASHSRHHTTLYRSQETGLFYPGTGRRGTSPYLNVIDYRPMLLFAGG